MHRWPDRRILDLFSIDLPIIQAPMAGPGTPQLAIAVSEAGGLGSLPCAQLSLNQAREALDIISQSTSRPINLNFFCHPQPKADPVRALAWRARLAHYYVEQGLDPEAPVPASGRMPFDRAYCALVEEYRPKVVSFHFGLPEHALLDRVKAAGAKVIASATTVAEAHWLEAHGCDAIIAMGLEAGGHRGNFLSKDLARQVGTFALVPQVADAVKVPVIAAGAVADARGIVAAFALGAGAVQIGTAYLFCPEAKVPPLVNRLMLDLGPISTSAPSFPLAGGALVALRAKSEPAGSSDFMNLWSGQAARLARELPAGELTKILAAEALAKLGQAD